MASETGFLAALRLGVVARAAVHATSGTYASVPGHFDTQCPVLGPTTSQVLAISVPAVRLTTRTQPGKPRCLRGWPNDFSAPT